MSNRMQRVLIAVVLLLFLSACVAGPNTSVDVPSSEGEVAGFFTGLWQGIIIPITFVISLFTENVSIYETHNTGGWYDFGFVLSVGTFLGSGRARAKRRRRR